MRRSFTPMLAAAIISLIAATTVPVHLGAQGRVLSPCARPMPTPHPQPRLPSVARPCAPSVVRIATSTVVELVGRVARTTTTETFENRGHALGEADFVFPLPSGAAFEELRLEIDGQLVPGEILDANSARATYERIVREQRDPALVEWAGLGLLRTRIFPFGAGERRTVVVKHAHVVPREGDALRVSGRLVTTGHDVSDERATGSFLIRWRGDSLGTPWSPTHDVQSARGRGTTPVQQVSLTGSSGDLIAYLPIRRVSREPGVTMITHNNGRGERHALVIVSPPRDAARPMPRDITLALDISGSMRGVKMTQAIAAGQALLGTLRSGDRFRLIAFADQVESQSSSLLPVNSNTLRDARAWLNGLDARGGTNIGDAMHEALLGATGQNNRTAMRAEQRVPLVLLLTDGQPTTGMRREQILDSTATWRGNARVFTFGVGEDVDASLVEQLALDGRGAAQFVRPNESVERAVSLTAQRLAAPLLADVQVRVNNGVLRELYAPHGVDLMAGQELVFLARYTGGAAGRVTVSGMSDDARRTVVSSYTFAARDSSNGFVPRLWAVQRVAALDAARRRHGPSTEIDGELRLLGQRFGIPTPLTSYLVLEPHMVGAQPGRGVRTTPVPQMGVTSGTRTRGETSAAVPPAAVAFESARRASEQRKVLTISAADALLGAEDANAVAAGRSRLADRRMFDLVDSVWTDRQLINTPEWRAQVTVRVQPFSRAWSALAQAIPSLREPFALGDRVRVRGQRAVIELAPNGVTDLDQTTLARLVAAW